MTKRSTTDPYSIKMRLLSEQPDEAPLELSPKIPYSAVCVPGSDAYGGTPIPSKHRRLYATFLLLFAAMALSAFVMYYAYETLINPLPTLGILLVAPSNTALVLSTLSQIVTFSFRQLFPTLFESVRWKFACQRKGVEMTTFLGLSTSTTLHGVLSLLYKKGRHRVWCLQRLLYPILFALIGLILTAGITYQNIYTRNSIVLVYGGLTPFNAEVLAALPTSVLCIYFGQWSYGILSSSRYTIGITPKACSGQNCTAVFLPGGIETPRERTLVLNESLYDGTAVEGSPNFVVENAPGYQLEFSSMNSNFIFNDSDCIMYGKEQGDGIYTCIGSNQSTISAGFSPMYYTNSGWSVCPTSLYETGSCSNNTNWTTPLQQTTSLNVFKRYATVAYDRLNASILDIETISDPETEILDPNDFRSVITKALFPDMNGSNDDITMSKALVFQLGFALRLYQETYPGDNHTVLNLLRGVLIVPIQWSFDALVNVNISETQSDPNSTRYAMPDDVMVRAFAASSTYRAMAKYPPTVYLFMGLVGLLLLCGNALFWYLYLQATVVPNTSLFPEIDIVSKSAFSKSVEGGVGDYNSVLREAGLANASSTAIVKEIKDKVLRVVEVDGLNGEKNIVIVVAGQGSETQTEGLDCLRSGINY